MPDLLPYPPSAPMISGSNITVDAFLADVARVNRTVNRLANQRFVADVIFGEGPQATGGAVIYDQVTASDLFLARDVQEIAPGAEFPILSDTVPTPKVAAVTKWGGRLFITDEQRDRNRIDVLRRVMTKLTNTIVRKVDAVAIATLEAANTAALTLTYGGADWTNTANSVFAQLAQLHLLVDQLDMGYELDTLLINPTQGADLLSRDDIRNAFTDSGRDAIVRNGTIGRLSRFDIIQTNRITAGTGWAVQRRMVGGISEETPLRARSYYEEKNERTWVQGSRRLVPYITDPKAAVKLTGI